MSMETAILMLLLEHIWLIREEPIVAVPISSLAPHPRLLLIVLLMWFWRTRQQPIVRILAIQSHRQEMSMETVILMLLLELMDLLPIVAVPISSLAPHPRLLL